MSHTPNAMVKKNPAGTAILLFGAFLALFAWISVYARLEYETILFLVKVVMAAALIGVPAGFFARMKKRDVPLWQPLLAGALVVLLGQYCLYAFLPDLEAGEPIGAAEAVKEILWDLSFQGAPGTLIGGMVFTGGGAAALARLISAGQKS